MQTAGKSLGTPSTVYAALVSALLLAACLGCGQDTAPDAVDQQRGIDDAGADAANGGRPDAGPIRPSEPPPPPTIPTVKLTDALRATCLIGVDDEMPEGELPDLTGEPSSLRSLHGERLTVVCFWTDGESEYAKLAAVDMLEFLAKDIAEPFLEKGVRVIGIFEGQSPQIATERLASAGATFPNLLDADAAYFGQVASERLPRIYLLDPQGKILWFDLEFSEITREALQQATEVALGD